MNIVDNLKLTYKLRYDLWATLFNDMSAESLYIRKLLNNNYFISDLSIAEADSVYYYFFKKKLDLNKLYNCFE